MRIIFTGGGTGGHFYPIIAVAEAVRALAKKKQLVEPELIYSGPEQFDERALFESDIRFIQSPAGKVRRYTSIYNVTDTIKTFVGILKALVQLFSLYPDVVFSKGGYASVPTVLAARILGIPVVIHESDAKPGRANVLASRFAKRIAISYPETAEYFKKTKGTVALTGTPVRKELHGIDREGGKALLKLPEHMPLVLVLGGSLGSARINETLLAALPDILPHAAVVHQTGKSHYDGVVGTAEVILTAHQNKEHYHAFPFLSVLSMRMAAGAATVTVSRAGSGTIAELSLWKKPAILIPIPEEISHDQRTNAYAYARTGGAIVIEESNLTPHVLSSEIVSIVQDPVRQAEMAEKGHLFARPEAAETLAEALIALALQHES